MCRVSETSLEVLGKGFIIFIYLSMTSLWHVIYHSLQRNTTVSLQLTDQVNSNGKQMSSKNDQVATIAGVTDYEDLEVNDLLNEMENAPNKVGLIINCEDLTAQEVVSCTQPAE